MSDTIRAMARELAETQATLVDVIEAMPADQRAQYDEMLSLPPSVICRCLARDEEIAEFVLALAKLSWGTTCLAAFTREPKT